MSKTFITDRKIRFGLVGCGRIAKNHFAALEAHSENAELVGVCDINKDALSSFTHTNDVKKYSSLKSMLKDTNADIIVLTTPSGLHPKQAIEVAKTNRHVLTEKPMATQWKDGVKMVKACEDAGVNLFVVKQNRLNATLQHLKKAIDANRFGKIYMVNMNVFWTRPQEYYDSGSWRGTWKLDGGAFMNQASHYIDLLTWLFGPVESVHAYTATLARKIEAEDSGVLSVQWKSGALGTVNVSMLTYPKNLEGSMTIIGEKGTVKIGGVAINKIEHWEFSDTHEEDKLIANANYETTSVYGFGHPIYYDNVIKSLQGKTEPYTNGSEGLKSLEVIIAAYNSAKKGKRINLPLA